MGSENTSHTVSGKIKPACGLLLGASVLLVCWAFVTWSRRGAFDTAVHAVFMPDPHADISVGWVELAYIAGPVLSLLFGVAFATFAILMLCRSYGWVPVVTLLVSVPVLVLISLTYFLDGRPYISAIGTGPDWSTAISETRRVDQLTRWRFSGWYHAMTLGFGIAIGAFILGAAVLLVISTSSGHLSRSRGRFKIMM